MDKQVYVLRRPKVELCARHASIKLTFFLCIRPASDFFLHVLSGM
jgi:hypothetical protein